MNLAINLIGTSNESGSKTYCTNFFNNLKRSAQLKNYKKIIIFISRSYLKNTKINKSLINKKYYSKNLKFN